MPPQSSSCVSCKPNASDQVPTLSVGDYVLCKLYHDSHLPPIVAQIISLRPTTSKHIPVLNSNPQNGKQLDSPHHTSQRLDSCQHSPHHLETLSSAHTPSDALSTPAHANPTHTNSPPCTRSQQPESPPHSVCTKHFPQTQRDNVAEDPCKNTPENLREDRLKSSASVYVHFLKHDHRLDRWESVLNVTPVTAPDPQLEIEHDNHTRTVTRAMTRAHSDIDSSQQPLVTVSQQPLSPRNSAAVPLHATKVRNVSNIVFGNYKIDTWYYSKIHLTQNHFDTLYVCPTCLALECNLLPYAHHVRGCDMLRPPGRLIYDDALKNVRVYEIDAYINQLYCMRFARIAKFFIEHKVICYDICPFMFYVVTVKNEIAGYFSKERSMLESDFNVSCILTFPQHQRKGIGSFLIALSYELSRRDGKTGTPERPLSDLGRISYTRYWTTTVLKWLRYNQPDKVRVAIRDISAATGITEDDVIEVLKGKNMYCVWKSEKCAENCHKSIDLTLANTPVPKIPLRSRNFKSRLQSATEPPCTSGSSSMVPSETISAPPFNSSHKKGFSKSKFSIKYNKNKSCSLKTPIASTLNGSYKKKGRPSNPKGSKYSPSQEKMIIEFIEKHSARTVLERLGSEEGISHQQLKDLAKLVGKDPVVVRKKLLRSSLIMSGALKLKNLARARCLSTKYVLEKMRNERCLESWSDEKISRSTPESSAASSDSLEAEDLDVTEDSTGANDDDTEQNSMQDVDQNTEHDDMCDDHDSGQERDVELDDQGSTSSKDEHLDADADDAEYTGLEHDSPEPAYYYEESDDDPYLDNAESPTEQSNLDGNKKRVKFNEEVVIKGGIVVIDD